MLQHKANLMVLLDKDNGKIKCGEKLKEQFDVLEEDVEISKKLQSTTYCTASIV